MNEEEIAEVFRRVKGEGGGVEATEGMALTNSSPHAQARLEQTDRHFQPMVMAHPQPAGLSASSLATVASVSIVSSLGLTYLLDKYKDKQDKNLRDELKDRVNSTLDDTKSKITDLEQQQNRLGALILDKDRIEAMLDQKIRKIQE